MADRRTPSALLYSNGDDHYFNDSLSNSTTFPPLQGFDFDANPQPNCLLTTLETPASKYRSDGRLNNVRHEENIYNAQENIILMCRTANFYIDFRDMLHYMFAIADALDWRHDVCESIFHQCIEARELLVSENPLQYAAVLQLTRGRTKLVCRLVDDFRLAPPPFPWQITESRMEFFQKVRDYWQNVILQTSAPFDPYTSFPTPEVSDGADWLYPRGGSLFVD